MSRSSLRIPSLAALLIGGWLACPATAADSGRGALEAAIQRWVAAVNARDEVALTATMTVDVELSDGTSTATGRDAAIRTLLQAAPGKQLIATTGELTIANDIAWHVAALAQRQKNGDVHACGRALEIWKLVDGKWKLHRRMAAGTDTPGAALTRPPANEPVLDRPKH